VFGGYLHFRFVGLCEIKYYYFRYLLSVSPKAEFFNCFEISLYRKFIGSYSRFFLRFSYSRFFACFADIHRFGVSSKRGGYIASVFDVSFWKIPISAAMIKQ
jgi:hypothetical protein